MRVKGTLSVSRPAIVSVSSWTGPAGSAFSLSTSFRPGWGVDVPTFGTTWMGADGPREVVFAVRVTAEKMGLVPSRRNIIALRTLSHRTSFRGKF